MSMADGGLALCILVTLCFGWFIFWGRSAKGQKLLRQTLGEPILNPKTKRSAVGRQDSRIRFTGTRTESSIDRKSSGDKRIEKKIKEAAAKPQRRTVKSTVEGAEPQKSASVPARPASQKGRKPI